VVWDKEREERDEGYTEERDGKGGKGKEGRKEGRRKGMTWPQTKFLDPPLIVSAQPAVPVYLTNVVILKMLSTS
jgi:hypothetical protein